jgi:hypothetical protein
MKSITIKPVTPLAAAVAALAALFCAISPVSAQEWGEDGPGFLKFNRGHSIAKKSEDITVRVGMIESDTDSDVENVWFLAAIEGGPWTNMRFRWADGASCPAALDLLKDVRRIELPSPVLPFRDGRDEGGEIVLDGRIYRLYVDSSSVSGQSSGRMYMESNTDTELSKWIDHMLRALEPCWSNKVPEGASERGGKADIIP